MNWNFLTLNNLNWSEYSMESEKSEIARRKNLPLCVSNMFNLINQIK